MKNERTILFATVIALAVAVFNITGTKANEEFIREYFSASAGLSASTPDTFPKADSTGCDSMATDSLTRDTLLRDTLVQDTIRKDSAAVYAPPVDSSKLMRDTLGIPMRDSIGRFIDTLGRSIDSLGRSLDSLGNPILPQRRIPSKAELRMYRRDSIKAVKDSIIQNTPRILNTYIVPDSMFYRRILTWTHDPHFNETKMFELDTTYNYHYYDFPFAADDVDGIYLGIAGSPAIRTNYFKRQSVPEARFFEPYLTYTYTPSTLPHYNTKTPYVELQYTGTLLSYKEKEEANLKVLATQNITPALNIRLEYRRFGGNGMLVNESTDNRTAVISANYLGKNYLMHAGYIMNRTKRSENGGIIDTKMIRDTMVDPREIKVWLGNAYSETRKNTVFLDQSLRIPFNFINRLKERKAAKAAADTSAMPSDSLTVTDSLTMAAPDATPQDSAAMTATESAMRTLGQKDGMPPADSTVAASDSIAESADITTAFIGMSNEYSVYRRRYTDEIQTSDESGRSFYNNAFFLDPVITNDSMRVAKFDNKIYLRLQPWAEEAILSKIDAGVGYRFQQYYLFDEKDYVSGVSSTNLNTFYAYAGANGTYKKYFQWDAFAKYNFAGYANNDLNIKANAKFSFYPFKDGSPISLTATFMQDLAEPWFYDQSYTSNHFRWRNNFSKRSETRVEALLTIPKYKLEASFGYSLIANEVYYDTLAIVRQNTQKPLSVMSAYVRKDFKLWKFHFDNRILFQLSSDQNVLPLPMLAVDLRYYLEFDVKKDVMSIQAGAEGIFTTKWYSPAYNPALGVFHTQNKETIGGSDPYINVFVNIQWKRACIFVKLLNVGENKKGSDYFSTYGYIRNPMTVKFGVFWPFYTTVDKHQRVEHDNK